MSNFTEMTVKDLVLNCDNTNDLRGILNQFMVMNNLDSFAKCSAEDFEKLKMFTKQRCTNFNTFENNNEHKCKDSHVKLFMNGLKYLDLI